MKKIILLLFILPLFAFQCEPEEIIEPCNCPIEGTRYISFDQGQTWDYNSTDGRSGEMFPCDYDGRETNQVYGEVVWYKTVWTCRD